MYSQEKILAEAARQGTFTAEAASRSSPEDQGGATEVQALVTVNELRTYAQACHQAAQGIFSAMSESELNRPVESPFGIHPAWRYFGFAYDEHWHHRGQLYTGSSTGIGQASAVTLARAGHTVYATMRQLQWPYLLPRQVRI